MPVPLVDLRMVDTEFSRQPGDKLGRPFLILLEVVLEDPKLIRVEALPTHDISTAVTLSTVLLLLFH